ncbi:EAL and HDOD domain-containing protein [Acidithiobacillus ferriphilus]|uniref:EAL and HDOD domain-containing protein n=1 Tax=Acidithiobacillus ferriphilus TaxID=1689834 RepID=UPI001C07555A|nr:HDOD domain-containing protein [Acidithiobacillus ferriphilus]MBU2844693.1 HDOD domain-containing protein [Acidithiobacillus ferriphilus]MBU2849176.1 HDOD domain-containing protein [Acidithiobacillus ferriphilus]MEB8536921.1 HDOD domain-containing protein [Acidithiobacillus ferriphilus]
MPVEFPKTTVSKDTQELIVRQAILGRQNEIIGYELFVRDEDSYNGPLTDPFLSSARVMFKTFNIFNVEQLLGRKPAFINFSNNCFDEESLALFPPKQIIPAFTIAEAPGHDFIEKMMNLRRRGFRLALDLFEGVPWQMALLKLVDFVRIDTNTNEPAAWEAWISMVRKANLANTPALIATCVETQAIARRCFEIGVDYSQGYYFMHPEIVAGRMLTENQRTIFNLLNLLAEENPVSDIEEIFRKDPSLSYQLLRYLNSAGLTRGQEIDSIRRALILLGRQPLQRWLTLLLFASQGGRKSPLLVIAATRARLAEMLRERSTLLESHPLALHRSFLVGMLSLLDAYLEQPMAGLLDELRLCPEMRAAIMEHQGEDGILLQIIEAVERGEIDVVRDRAASLGFTIADITRISLESMAWAASLE